MRLLCSQKELANALSFVGRGVGNNTLPVLNNVYLKAAKNRLHLATTNLEIAIQYSIEARVEVEGETTIPAKLLGGYVGYLKEGDIAMELNEGEELKIKTDGSNTSLKGIAASEFPVVPSVDADYEFTVQRTLFIQALNQVCFAASLNTTRPILSGVYFSVKPGQLVMAATDSYRLAQKTLEISAVKGEVDSVVPIRTLIELQGVLGNFQEDSVHVTLSKNQVLFKVGELMLTSRLVEGQYPQYQAVIPKELPTSFEVANSDFGVVLKRLNLFAKENNYKIHLKTTSTELTLNTPQTQLGGEEVHLPVAASGPDAELAVNSQYVLDVLTNIGVGDVEFKLGSKTTPLMIVPKGQSDYLHIVMPLKV